MAYNALYFDNILQMQQVISPLNKKTTAKEINLLCSIIPELLENSFNEEYDGDNM